MIRKIIRISIMTFGFMLYVQFAVAQLDGKGIAPNFVLEDLDGVSHDLYEYLDQGKVVILDFFAVWCSICQADAPYLGELYEEFGPAGSNQIELLSLESDDASSDSQTRDYALNFLATNPHINNTKLVPEDYKVNFFPSYYVVAPDRSYTMISGRQLNMKLQMIEAINQAPALRNVENDVKVMSFSDPKGSICGFEFIPKLRIQNYGKNEISGMIVETWIDGELESSYPYNGNLQPYHFTDLELPAVMNLNSGWHEIEFMFDLVNGKADGDTSNGGGGDFLILPEGVQINVELTTDAYPTETSWKIFENEKLVAEVDGYRKGIFTSISDICIEEEKCYRLIIYDNFGDGMSSGSIKIRFKDEVIGEIQSYMFNADSSWVDFCVIQGTSGIDNYNIESSFVKAYPNPSNGNFKLIFQKIADRDVLVEVLDINGRVQQSKILPMGLNNLTINLSNSPAGIYFVRLETNNKTQTLRILVNR